MKNPCHKVGSIHIVTVLLQPFKVDPFTAKYFNKISFFSNSNYYDLFSSHTLWPREWACGLWIVYLVYLFFLYLSHAFIFFDETFGTVYRMYSLQAKQFTG